MKSSVNSIIELSTLVESNVDNIIRDFVTDKVIKVLSDRSSDIDHIVVNINRMVYLIPGLVENSPRKFDSYVNKSPSLQKVIFYLCF